VLAADTRATGGSIVGDKNCEKIHYLAPNVFCCGAGTAADCDHVTGMFYKELTKFISISHLLLLLAMSKLVVKIEMIKRELELHRLSNHMENRV
jgi:20S proteasome subunit beta 2